MKKTNNDILAEYVRKRRPEIERTMDYAIYKLVEQVKNIAELIKESDIGKLQGVNPYKEALELYEGEWIPVDQRLPELNEDGTSDTVLLCWSDGQFAVGAYAGDRTFVGQGWPEATGASVKVVAWMPLPDPYDDGSLKGEEE